MSSQVAPSAQVIEHVSSLIGFDTVSRNSNLALIEWAANRLESAGAQVRFDYNESRSKANLLATFGQGPGGVVLSGHTDVVPVDGQAWSGDPFQAQIRDGRLFGRGACDMKGFIGVAMAQAQTPGLDEAARARAFGLELRRRSGLSGYSRPDRRNA